MMVSTDPIADMLTRIRNASLVRKPVINLPHSKIKEGLAKLLKANNYIDSLEVTGEGIAKQLSLQIFDKDSNPRITEIVRLSKPGRHLYSKANDIPTVKNGRGLVIISTSQGLMTGHDAKAKRLGGELICRVY